MVETIPRPSFYSGPTPRLQHLTRARPRHAPATKPAAEVLPALVMLFASWVTWLEGVIPQASDRMCELPPAIVSASWQNAKIGYFGGQNTEATPYPSITAFRRSLGKYGLPNSVFGSVSQDTNRQALAGLSWLSFSRPLDLPTVPEHGQCPAPTVTSRRLPTPAHVQRTCPFGQTRSP
jgi:hypothetical protein